MISAALDLNEKLTAAATSAQFFAAVKAALVPFGVSDIAYGGITSTGKRDIPVAFDIFHVSLSPEMAAHLGGQRRYDHDLTVERAVQGLDTIWTADHLWESASDVQVAQSMLEIETGVRVGYTRALNGAPNRRAAVGLRMDPLTIPEFDRHWAELSARIFPMLDVMEAHHAKGPLAAHYALSPREKDTLSWLALGLRPSEIAHRLGIHKKTVEKYVEGACLKLGARTRDHAVARALVLGLITL